MWKNLIIMTWKHFNIKDMNFMPFMNFNRDGILLKVITITYYEYRFKQNKSTNHLCWCFILDERFCYQLATGFTKMC